MGLTSGLRYLMMELAFRLVQSDIRTTHNTKIDCVVPTICPGTVHERTGTIPRVRARFQGGYCGTRHRLNAMFLYLEKGSVFDIMGERVLDFLGYPTYAILSDGRVRDLRTGVLHTGHCSNGYRRINLMCPDGSKLWFVHRLVALAFLPNPNALPEVDHINRIPHDNRLENLRWCNDELQNQNKGVQVNNKLGERNINMDGGYYRVSITRNGVRFFHKRFATLEKAVQERDAALRHFSLG